MTTSDRATCDGCGRVLDPHVRHHWYGPHGPEVLCADCFRRRCEDDAGHTNQDLGADVDQELSGDPAQEAHQRF